MVHEYDAMLLRRLRSRGRVAQLYYGADSQFAASGSPQQGACCSIISAVTTEYRGCLNRYVTCVTFVVVRVCFTLLVFSCTSAVSTAGHQLFTAQLIFKPTGRPGYSLEKKCDLPPRSDCERRRWAGLVAGMVQPWVGQIRLNCNVLKTKFESTLGWAGPWSH